MFKESDVGLIENDVPVPVPFTVTSRLTQDFPAEQIASEETPAEFPVTVRMLPLIDCDVIALAPSAIEYGIVPPEIETFAFCPVVIERVFWLNASFVAVGAYCTVAFTVPQFPVETHMVTFEVPAAMPASVRIVPERFA